MKGTDMRLDSRKLNWCKIVSWILKVHMLEVFCFLGYKDENARFEIKCRLEIRIWSSDYLSVSTSAIVKEGPWKRKSSQLAEG